VGVDLRPLWPFAVLATCAVVLVPLAAVLLLATIGLPEPRALVAAVVCVVLSIGAAAVGTSFWTRRRESVDVAFGELMLWRFLRRHKAERTIDESAAQLGLGPDWTPRSDVVDLDPRRALDMLQRLTGALEAKDPYTHGHSRRVERHVHRTAMAMGLSSDQIKELRTAASLHDVGKIRVPSQILRKPEALNDHETEVMREHVHVGAAMVGGAASSDVTAAIRHHHEQWNGSGYPSGLAEHAIPLYARIITVADTYDALTSARPYKAGCSRKEALQVLRDGAGVQFDPRVVEAFISTLPAALPAVSALLVFVRPEAVARRVVTWGRLSAAGSVTTGAVAAGSAAAIITAGMVLPPGAGSVPVGRQPLPKAAAVELVEDATDDTTVKEPARRHRTEKAESEDVPTAPPGRVAGAPTEGSSNDDDVDHDASALQPSGDDDQGGGPGDGNGAPGNDGSNGNGPPESTPPVGGAEDDPAEPSPPVVDAGDDTDESDDDDDEADDDDDEADDDDEDCDPKNGQGHESHGQGQGNGHDKHCGE
jgi:hypothetical protein